ncbi:MAG: rhomboid family intramembrane serine protease [Planctomycetes bacterium]|nr:rhomboid family intramembrane serine protease [Planctomycetota bacterium]
MAFLALPWLRPPRILAPEVASLKGGRSLIAIGGKDTPSILAGEYWRLISMMFLHSDLDHLIGNSVIIYVLGSTFEHAFGPQRMFAVYTASGVAAALASCLQNQVSVGASGAIFGVMGALGASLYKNRHRLFFHDARLGVVFFGWAVYILIQGFLSPYVDNLAHSGGLLAGPRDLPAVDQPAPGFQRVP